MSVTSNPQVKLPSIPLVAVRLLEAYSDPNLSLDRIVSIVKMDPALTAKVLKFANSPLHGKGRVSTLNQAVSWLGRHALTCLALSFALSEKSQKPGLYASLFKAYWMHSVVQAVAMQQLSKRVDPDFADAAFVAGLLMDIGRLTFLQRIPDRYAVVCQTAQRDQRPLCEVELECIGTSHAAVSGQMLESWGFPETTVQLARQHHLDVQELLCLEHEKGFQRLAIANVGSAAAEFFMGINPAQALRTVHRLVGAVFGLPDERIDALLEDIRQEMTEAREMLAFDPSQLPPPTELLAAAMEQLVQISLGSTPGGDAEAGADVSAVAESDALRVRLLELERKTCLDALTQVYNRDYFQQRVQQRLRSASETAQRTVVLFFDLDKFKRINDTYGHLAGDTVLTAFASVLRKTLRENDVVARYGGEEFVALIQLWNEDEIRIVAERIRANLARTVIDLGQDRVCVTASMGAAVLDVEVEAGDEARAAERLIAIADQAMYEVKRAGGDGMAILRSSGGSVRQSA